MRHKKQKIADIAALVILLVLSATVLLPVVFITTHSFMSSRELNAAYGQILTAAASADESEDEPVPMDPHLIPREP